MSHQDIMSKSCSVKMLNLMEQEVKELQDSHKSGMLSSTSSPESMDNKNTSGSDSDWVPVAKRKAPFSN